MRLTAVAASDFGLSHSTWVLSPARRLSGSNTRASTDSILSVIRPVRSRVALRALLSKIISTAVLWRWWRGRPRRAGFRESF
jgi:hypothetical protein